MCMIKFPRSRQIENSISYRFSLIFRLQHEFAIFKETKIFAFWFKRYSSKLVSNILDELIVNFLDANLSIYITCLLKTGCNFCYS